MKLFSTLFLSLALITSAAQANIEGQSNSPYTNALQNLLSELDEKHGVAFSDILIEGRNDRMWAAKVAGATQSLHVYYEVCKNHIKNGISVDEDLGFGYGTLREMVCNGIEFFEGIKALELAKVCEYRSFNACLHLYASVLLKNLKHLIDVYQPEAKA